MNRTSSASLKSMYRQTLSNRRQAVVNEAVSWQARRKASKKSHRWNNENLKACARTLGISSAALRDLLVGSGLLR